ncbi:unnamed protein product [Arabis nemorensis]|uniref:Uncharacterized protein n=1 Tax=Arabis nemorensis TaxID=586526 RepID=A0A565CFV5_9BRAS|nr:unnamed protein product [Arabis nemorensis]
MGVCNTRGQMYNRGVCGQSRPKTAGFFCHDAMSKVEALVEKPAKFYSAEDVEKPLANKHKPKALRSSITPESVLIILAGRFKGKRVVFLAAGNRLRWSENYLEQAAIYKLKRMIQDMLGNELYIGAYMESNAPLQALEACFNNSPFKKLLEDIFPDFKSNVLNLQQEQE